MCIILFDSNNSVIWVGEFDTEKEERYIPLPIKLANIEGHARLLLLLLFGHYRRYPHTHTHTHISIQSSIREAIFFLYIEEEVKRKEPIWL